ncbi:hypothetical protein EYF80_030375 [Liparis tanakae]|uniref:Uncharacterized protein n=1 Tax=Liparis tanakae TaxID=230148 RepID=A0A4Z2H1N7_9TELE|nr:hypothetical protein EYF80_030375 [Liparis tanakae]
MLHQRSSTQPILTRASSMLGIKLESHPQCLSSSICKVQHNLHLPKDTPRASPHPSTGHPNKSHKTNPLPSRDIQFLKPTLSK